MILAIKLQFADTKFSKRFQINSSVEADTVAKNVCKIPRSGGTGP